MKKKTDILVNRLEQKTWDNFVKNNDGSFYHLFNWSKVNSQALGLPAYYVSLFTDGILTGLFPSSKRRNLIQSLPFSDHGGLLSSNPTLLWPALSSFLAKGEFEIFMPEMSLNRQAAVQVHSIFTLPIKDDYSLLFSNHYHHKTRNMVRKASKNGVTTTLKPLGQNDLSNFYLLYLKTMKKIGTVAMPQTYFALVAQSFSKESLLVEAWYQGKCASLIWLFDFNKKLYIWANVSDEHLLWSGANYAVYDAAISHASKKGYREVVLGASDPKSSQGFFKSRWGAIETPVYLVTNKQGEETKSNLQKALKSILPHLPDAIYVKFCQLAFKFFI